MFKKYKIVAALVTIGLVGGSFGQTVGASANYDGNTGNQQNESNYQYSDKNYSNNLEQFLNKCFAKWNIKWDQNAWKNNWNSNQNQVERPADKVEQQPTEPAQPSQPTQPEQQGQNNNQNQADQLGQLNQFEQQVVELTNKERAKYGLAPLQVDYELSRVAHEKSRDMAINNYFDHNSPVYGSPFDMIKAYGINYRAAGENIAKGQRSPEEVVNAWMNSEGHRANILNGSFTHIGVGYVEQGNHWTQQFIGK